MKKTFIISLFALFASVAVANENIREVTEKQFKDEIKEGIVLVDFWATWCMPCRMQGRELKLLAFEARDYLKIIKIDVDKNPAVSKRFYVSSIPTLLIFKDGHLKKRIVGFSSKDDLIEILNQIKEE